MRSTSALKQEIPQAVTVTHWRLWVAQSNLTRKLE
jgi:hypothetical protein